MSLDRPLQIRYTRSALQDLNRIQRYISFHFSKRTAVLWIGRIMKRASELTQFPEVGMIDPFLGRTDPTIRYIIFKKARIRYAIHENSIVILRVHDVRQNPMSFTED